MTDATPSEQRAATTSLGELLSEVTTDVSTLLRQELALAKAELRQTVSTGSKGAGLLGGAGYAGSMTVLFLSIALWAALSFLVGGGWAGLIVAGLWLIIATVLYLAGRAALAQARGVPQTVATLQEIPPTLRRNEENR